MNNERAVALRSLTELLQSDADVGWIDVEQLLAGFPAWLGVIAILRTRPDSPASVYGFQAFAPPGPFVTDMKRERLLGMFLPYALLLDERRTPEERAALLESDAGMDVARFCRECLDNEMPDIAEAAQQVLDAHTAQSTLLRGSGQPAESSNHLLRAPQTGTVSAADLLHPLSSEPTTPADDSTPAEASNRKRLPTWLQRFRRH